MLRGVLQEEWREADAQARRAASAGKDRNDVYVEVAMQSGLQRAFTLAMAFCH